MSLADIFNLANIVAFQQRVQAQLDVASIAIFNEVANEAQTITISGGSSGTFTISFGGQTTAPIAFNATAAAVQTALQALSSIGSGNVVCTGGPLATNAVTATFTGTLGNMPQNLMTATNPTGGTTTIARVTTGVAAVNHGSRAALASKILANSSGYAAPQLMTLGVAADATVQTDYLSTNPPNQANVTDAHIVNAVSSIFNAYT